MKHLPEITNWQEIVNEVVCGDCLEGLRKLPDECVDCCVTSPPYFWLRDYGVEGQIGLEGSPDEYVKKMVEVFSEVKRVLKKNGTLWLNLGDSYAGGGRGGDSTPKQKSNRGTQNMPKSLVPNGLKQKDLIGIPWRVAFALQQPYYTGKVQDERDRVWLAAMLDAEGSICGTEYETGDRTKTNLYISVTNTSVPIIEKCERLFPQDAKHVYEKTNGVSNRRCFRWDVERIETKALFLREVYPYLVAKRKQAILGYTFLEMQRGLPSKKQGYLPEQHEQRSWLMAALSRLNAGDDVDVPNWAIEPPSLHEPGFYLRQDIIWHKPNPMPESVTDRCTKSHEYIFLLAKSQKYFFDAEAIKEQVVCTDPREIKSGLERSRLYGYETKENELRTGKRKNDHAPWSYAATGSNVRYHSGNSMNGENGIRNKRSVWTVTTQPFKDAHFATFPEDLILPCVQAGSAKGGLILDPFMGAGTTARVAKDLGRNFIGFDLNPDYCAIAEKRLRQEVIT